MLDNACSAGFPAPLLPHEVDAVQRVFERARRHTKLSPHDVKCQRLAAMAIRFYQLGIHDEGALLANIVNAHGKLNELPTASGDQQMR